MGIAKIVGMLTAENDRVNLRRMNILSVLLNRVCYRVLDWDIALTKME